MLKVVKRNNKLFAVKKEQTVFNSGGFTKVGSPDVTEDGVASGFSSGNYIKITDLDFSKPWMFQASETVSAKMSGVYGWGNGFNVQPQGRRQFYFILRSLNSGNLLGSFNALNKEKVYYRVSWDGSVYKLEMKADDDETYTTVKTFTSSETLTGTTIFLGYNANSGYASNGQYNLKDVRFISGGVEVFSGTKTITKLFAVKRIRT